MLLSAWYMKRKCPLKLTKIPYFIDFSLTNRPTESNYVRSSLIFFLCVSKIHDQTFIRKTTITFRVFLLCLMKSEENCLSGRRKCKSATHTHKYILFHSRLIPSQLHLFHSKITLFVDFVQATKEQKII